MRATRLCALAELPLNKAAGVAPGLFAIRMIDRVVVYRNACPHLGVQLDWLPGRFMSEDGRFIICATHGAEFRPEDGVCVRGPCRGDRLTAIACEVADGAVWVDQGTQPGPPETK